MGQEIASLNGVTMVIERRWWHVLLTFEIDGIRGQETSIQWSSSGQGACVTAGIELGIAMGIHASTEVALGLHDHEPYRYQLKFMEWGEVEVET